MPERRKTPEFLRQESWRYLRVKESWRRPRGKSSRVRRGIKGWPPLVKVGYKQDSARRGLHPSGLREIIVYRAKDLEGLDPKVHAIRIAHTVGKRKRNVMLEKAKEIGLRVLNPGPKEEKPAAEEELALADEAPTEAKEGVAVTQGPGEAA